MKTLVLMMSLLSLLIFSIGCNKSEERKGTTSDSMQREESRAEEFPSDVKEDIQEEEADVREEQMDVESEKDDVQNTIDKARDDMSDDETKLED